MQRRFSHSIVLSLLVAGMMTAIPAQAQTPSLIPASGCFGFDGKELATCPPPLCLFGITVGGICMGIPIPASCDFRTGMFFASCIPAYIAYLIGVIFGLSGAIFLLMLILGGYQYVIGKAGGGGGEEGKARVRFAIVGFLVTALSFYIVDFILSSL